MDFSFREIDDSYLVWLQPLNRYLQLEEPAFRILIQLKEDLPFQEIVRACSQRYQLPLEEAGRFVAEIKEQIQLLCKNYQKPEVPSVPLGSLTCPSSYMEKEIAVMDRRILFSFGDLVIEQFIFPLFSHLEHPHNSESWDLHMQVYIHNGSLFLIKNQKYAYKWVKADAFKLKGAIMLDVINLMHDASDESWMGVIHASSVCYENRAVMFPAQPGAGKSTLAALLLAHGCKLLSDDFTPVAMENQHIYPFPGAISVKKGSKPLLNTYFPELKRALEVINPSKGEKVSYLAPPELDPLREDGYPVSAIVFVQFDEEADCELVQVNNLEVINDFLTESWLVHKAVAAEKFMDWYLRTPCYKLRYGNHKKAVESIKKLF